MDVTKHDSREVCAVCWGVCGFASSRENLEMARSQEGLTSFCQAKDLFAASAQCRMCDYLFKTSKRGIKAYSLRARVAIKTRFHEFKRTDSWRNSADNLTIYTKVEGIDSDWGTGWDWSKETGAMRWSVLAHRGDPAAAEIQWSPVNYDDSSSTKQAKLWIERCKQRHKHCPEPTITVLPTRVLDVSDDQYIRLHIPGGERCHYCTLSYCWGGPQPVRTLAKNIESHKAGIRVSDLPRTIQDAASCTRELGIKYLWVDSLCIVQDSVDDKRQEIARMASIYQNAFVTIAATNASKCAEGFLSKRRRPSYEIFIGDLPWSCLDGRIGKVSLHCQCSETPREEPLNQRAWALQETLLSPRVLSFSSQQLVWECQTFRYTDGGDPGSQPFHEIGKSRAQPSLFSPLTAAMVPFSPRSDSAHRVWRSVVKNFTRREITEESDKLLAISGIAQQLHLITGDRYLAGLWEAFLMFELMWSHDSVCEIAQGSQPAGRPETYRAPSWSWASVDGAIEFSDLPTVGKLVAEVIQCEVVLANSSKPFGAVVDGHLVIRGPLRSLEVNEVLQYFDPGPTNFLEVIKPRIILDGNEVLPSSGAVSLPDSIQGDGQIDQRIWFLEMARWHEYPVGLVLRQSYQNDHRLFHRIGWFDTRSPNFFATWWTHDTPIETITIV